MEQALGDAAKQQIAAATGGKTLNDMSRALLQAIDPDVVAERATGRKGAEAQEVDPQFFAQTREKMITEACLPFDQPEVRDTLARIKQQNEQTIDVTTIDLVTNRGYDAAAKQKAEGIIRSFREYIEKHKAEIEALQILYNRPFRQRLTEESLRELEAKLKPKFGPQPVPAIWNAFEKNGRARSPSAPRSQTRRFTDLVSLVRVALEREPILEPFEEHVRQRFNAWLQEKRAAGTTFTADEMTWLEKMRDYISASGSVDREHLEADNVLGPIYKAFGERLWPLMEELNLTLAA
jgi:type I restriction enzyme R subunit